MNGSPVRCTNFFTSSSWPFRGWAATTVWILSSSSLPTVFTYSGVTSHAPTPWMWVFTPNSFTFWSTWMESGKLVAQKKTMSGWVARSFCTMEVASGRGGVHTSSTTSSMHLACSSFSRRGLKKKTVAAVLSPTTAAFRIGWLFRLASSTTRSRACSAWAEETGEVWKVYLNPRSVMLSAYESVSHGTCSRSATSVTPRVNELSQEPIPALIFSRVRMRWAALTAFSTLSPASASRRTILAPPSALMPPWLLISSMAISAPIFLSCPCRAQRPERGTTSAILRSSTARTGGATITGAVTSRASARATVRAKPLIGVILQLGRDGHPGSNGGYYSTRARYTPAREEPRDASGDLSGVGRGGGSAGRGGRAARARRGRGRDRGRGDRRELCRFPDGGGALPDTT